MINKEFMDITFEDIQEWCVANGQVDWLEEVVNRNITQKRYTRRIEKRDENGNVVRNKRGYVIKVVDKSSPIIEVEAPITFVEVKTLFCKSFMPHKLPASKVEKKLSMRDKVKLLKQK